ncbi:MAG: hypothetical protein AAF750_06585 [Planctomycetota bacterium]
MTTTLTPELRSAFDEIKKGVEDVPKIKSAVEQLEEQHKGIEESIEKRIAAAQRRAFDNAGN